VGGQALRLSGSWWAACGARCSPRSRAAACPSHAFWMRWACLRRPSMRLCSRPPCTCWTRRRPQATKRCKRLGCHWHHSRRASHPMPSSKTSTQCMRMLLQAMWPRRVLAVQRYVCNVCTGEWHWCLQAPACASTLDLKLTVAKGDGACLECSLRYNKQLYEARTAQRMLGHLMVRPGFAGLSLPVVRPCEAPGTQLGPSGLWQA